MKTVKLVSDCLAETGWDPTLPYWQPVCFTDSMLALVSDLLSVAYVWTQLIVVFKMLSLRDEELVLLGCFGPLLSVTFDFLLHHTLMFSSNTFAR